MATGNGRCGFAKTVVGCHIAISFPAQGRSNPTKNLVNRSVNKQVLRQSYLRTVLTTLKDFATGHKIKFRKARAVAVVTSTVGTYILVAAVILIAGPPELDPPFFYRTTTICFIVNTHEHTLHPPNGTAPFPSHVLPPLGSSRPNRLPRQSIKNDEHDYPHVPS